MNLLASGASPIWTIGPVDGGLIELGHFEFYEDNQGHFVFCAVKG
jgi:hypothetical protein